MANPARFEQFTPANSRQDLLRRLETAPEEHVEALLASYELLQRMHEEGLIDLANGMLSTGGVVMRRLADVMKSREGAFAFHAIFMLTNLLRVMDLGELHLLLSGARVPSTSFVGLGRKLVSSDVRAGLATSIGLLKIFGAAIRKSGET